MDDPPNSAAYMDALVVWAKSYNLIDDEWCRVWLSRTLWYSELFGASNPEAEPQIVLAYEFDGPPRIEPPELPELKWNPFEIPRQLMTRRYNDYLDKVEDTYRRVGYRSTLERRESAHIWWLAGYQVCGWSKNAVAGAVSVDRAAVIRAIQRLARLISLTLRATAANDQSWTPKKIQSALPPVT